MKCRPVEIALEYVFDRKRGISSKTTEENEAEVPGVKMSGGVHQLDLWLGGGNNRYSANVVFLSCIHHKKVKLRLI